MADFSTSWGPSGSPVGVQDPVQKSSASSETVAIAGLLQGLGGVFSAVGEANREKKAQEAELFNATTVNNFSRDQLALTEAVETGQMSSAAARSKMRANLSRALADNPMLLSDLTSAHKEVTKSSGLGTYVYEGTPEERALEEAKKDAITSGWARADASPEEIQSAIEKKRNFNYNMDMLRGQTAQLGALNAQLQNQRGHVGLAKDRLSLQTAGVSHQTAIAGLEQAQLKRKSQMAVAQIAFDGLTPFQNTMQNIAEKMKSGEVSAVEGQRAMDNLYGQMESTLRVSGAFAGNDMVGNQLAIYKNYLDLEKGYANGTIDLEQYNRENQTNLARATAAMSDDPDMATFAAMAKMFPSSEVVMRGDLNHALVGFLKGAVSPEATPPNPFPNSPAEAKVVKNGLDTVVKSVAAINSGKASAGTEEQVVAWMNKTLQGVQVYGQMATDPAQYKEFVRAVSDPNMGDFILKHSGEIDNASLSTTADMIQYRYKNEVLPALQAEFEQAVVGNTSAYDMSIGAVPNVGRPATSAIDVKFIGSGITFQAKPGVSEVGLLRRVEDLNKRVKPLFNEILRASAHLSGTKDYRAVYESDFQEIFGGKKEEAKEE